MDIHKDIRPFIITITNKSENKPIESYFIFTVWEILTNSEKLKQSTNCELCLGVWECTESFLKFCKKLFPAALVHIYEESKFFDTSEQLFFKTFFNPELVGTTIAHVEIIRQNIVRYMEKEIEKFDMIDIINIFVDWNFFDEYWNPEFNKCEDCKFFSKSFNEMKNAYMLYLESFISHLPSLPYEFKK